jgi:uncharacterized protein YukE
MSDKRDKSSGSRRPSEASSKNLREEKKDDKKDKALMNITGPLNVVHVGHVGFDSSKGRFEWHGLPEAYQRLFTNLDKTLKSMGVKGLTQQEAKLLIKALPTLGANNPSQPPTISKKSSDIKKNEKNIEVSAPVLKQSSNSKINQPVTVLTGDAVTALKEALQKQHVKVEELKVLVEELKEENAQLTKKLEEAKKKNESVAELKEKLKNYETNLTLRTKTTEETNAQIEKYKKRAEKYKKKYRDTSAENENLKLQLANLSEVQQRLDQKANRATVQIDDVYKQLKLENEGLKDKLERESNKRREVEKEKRTQESKCVELQTSLKHAQEEIEELKRKLEKARQSSHKYKARLKKVQQELEEATAGPDVPTESASSRPPSTQLPPSSPSTSSSSAPTPPPPPPPPSVSSKVPSPPPPPPKAKAPPSAEVKGPNFRHRNLDFVKYQRLTSLANLLCVVATPKSPAPSGTGRDALLESIRSSNKGALRHVVCSLVNSQICELFSRICSG